MSYLNPWYVTRLLRITTVVVSNCVRFSVKVRVRVERQNDASIRHVASYQEVEMRVRTAQCARERINKVKHLSRVNGNINTPRRLRLETSRARYQGL